MKILFLYIITSLFIIPCISQASVSSARIYMETLDKTHVLGEREVVVKIQSPTEKINALSGVLDIPQGVEIGRIYTGSSALVMWLEQPKAGKKISFSGITPGGIQGDLTLFSFSYKIVDGNNHNLDIQSVEAHKDDGLGTVVALQSIPFRLSDKIPVSTLGDIDTDSPEPFDLVFGKEKEAYEGKTFLSFIAQDKKSGVTGYQVATTWFGEPDISDWTVTESPFIPSFFEKIQKISIKAIDGEGNKRIESISGPYRYTFIAVGSIILATLCVLFCFVRPSL